MGKIKIHEIAKETGLTSKELIAKAQELGLNVTSHLSGVEEEQAEKIKNACKNKKVVEKPQVNAKKEASSPVIIRREVINNDNETEKEEEAQAKQEEQRSKNVGFVERNKNADYNIVYRNKPNKPLTVSELFGLGKKEEKAEEKVEEAKIEIKAEAKIEEKKEEIKPEVREEKEESKKENMIEAKPREVENKENSNFRNTNTNSNGGNQGGTSNTGYRTNPNSNNNGGYRLSPNTNTSANSGYRNNQDGTSNNGYRPNPNNNNNNNGGYRPNPNNQNNNTNGGYRNNYNNNRPNQDGTNTNGGYRNNYNNNRPNQDGTNTNGGYRNNYNNNRPNQDGTNNNNNGYRPNPNGGFRNNNGNNNGYRPNPNGNNNGFRNNNQNQNQNFNRDRRPLDDRGIDKNIKDIMAIDIMEKENQRDYSSKSIDKVKNERYEDKSKKVAKNKKTGRFNEEIDDEKLKDLKQVDRLSKMFGDQEGGMLDYYDLTTARGKRNKRKATRIQDDRTQKIFKLTEIEIPNNITVKDLAAELKKTTGDVIKKLLGYGIMATINNDVDFDTAFLLAQEFGVTAKKKEKVNEEDILFDDSEDVVEELQVRPPVVCVMGHVDHGKTSLLDAIRSTNVIEGEAGGITQTIGAYKVSINNREITFLDTPGHEAFTSMRARGAQITDIAILVVAANDGVMPQTIEAINHAKAAGTPIIVAVNKMDLPEANIQKVKEELMKYELVPEEWGGETIYVPISAKKRTNIDGLLEMVLLQADLMELTSNPKKQAKGVVIEARLDKSKGPIASMLVQRGTLDIGDTIVVGSSIGRIRAMKNDKGQKVKKAGPSTPVEIMGLTALPESGDIFYEVKDEKMAKHLIEKRRRQAREENINSIARVTLDNLFTEMEKGNVKQLNIIVKADVQGSAEALKQSLEKLSDEEVKVRVINAVAGAVNESDVNLAKVANAIIIAFNVRPVVTAKAIAERDEVEIKQYSIIYQAIDDVKSAMKGLLDPIFEEKVIGTVEVRQTFKVSNVGTIAGAYVTDGKIERNAGVRVIREDVVVHEGKLATLKRFKDDVKEIAKGYECGIQIEGYNDIKEGDTLEVYVMEEKKR